MPTPSEILAGLTQIANQMFAFAVLWHALVAITLIAWLAGARPSRRATAALLAAPLASVAVFAWSAGNPFNGLVFAALAITLLVLGLAAPRLPVRVSTGWPLALGALLVAFGWIYPHFLVDRSPLAYLYGAPLGLIPCPTLAMTTGLALLTGAPGGRAWSTVLALAAVFYALFGALRLGVWLDLPLLLGGLGLLSHGLRGARGTRSVAVPVM